jgi:beta-lactamase class A
MRLPRPGPPIAVAILACLAAGSPAAVAAGRNGPILPASAAASFARLERSLGGRSGIAVAPLGIGVRPVALGALRSSVAWSTSKVPIAMAVITAGEWAPEQSDLRRAITASDNAAALRLFASLGDPATAAAKETNELRGAGDMRTVIESRRLRPRFTAFGQTAWRLNDQARFTAGMTCSDGGRQVLALMGETVAAQRWGLGATTARAQLKGGWGPGTKPGVDGRYVDRQMGVLTLRGRSFAAVIATVPADGRHATGTAHLTTIARWLVSHADVRGLPAEASCP